MAKINRENISEHLLDYQLSMIDRSIYEALINPKWREEWCINEEQYNQFKRYAIPLLKKVFRCNKSKAEKTLEWFHSQFGLKIK
jgi:hypothetical protein